MVSYISTHTITANMYPTYFDKPLNTGSLNKALETKVISDNVSVLASWCVRLVIIVNRELELQYVHAPTTVLKHG